MMSLSYLVGCCQPGTSVSDSSLAFWGTMSGYMYDVVSRASVEFAQKITFRFDLVEQRISFLGFVQSADVKEFS